MGYKSLGVPTGNAKNLPWLEEWIESLPKKERKAVDKQFFPVVKMSFSLKGVTLQTACFSVFVFKKTPLYDHLAEAGSVWGDGADAKELLIHLVDVYSAVWDIGVDEEVLVKWESEKLGKVLLRKDSEEEDVLDGSNPFL